MHVKEPGVQKVSSKLYYLAKLFLKVYNINSIVISFLVFGDMAMTYTVEFNNENTYEWSKQKDDAEEEPDGPIVERKCPQCGNEQMSYATLQLRSADEGQTVFFTCTKCK